MSHTPASEAARRRTFAIISHPDAGKTTLTEHLLLLGGAIHAAGRVKARGDARRTTDGGYVPLAEQDPARWNEALITEAETLLFRASALGRFGRYQLEAAVQSAHVVRRRTGRADWAAIVDLYDALLAITGSPVVAINRAIAIAETGGPAAGLASLRALEGDRRLAQYQPYWAALASLLERNREIDEAGRAYEQAIGLESDPAVRSFLLQRRSKLAAGGTEGA